MNPVERHAELIYAETLFQKVCGEHLAWIIITEFLLRLCSALSTLETGFHSSKKRAQSYSINIPVLTLLRHRLNLRTTFTTYRQLAKYLEVVDGEARDRGEPFDTSIDADFRSGVLLGAGLSNLVLSLMPSRLLSIVELFGFHGSRLEGLEMLYKAGGWTKGCDEPSVSAEEEGVRRSICDMVLLIFHLVMSSFTHAGVDIPMAQKILEWNLARYPSGVFFLFGHGRLALLRAQARQAIASYTAAMRAQTQYANLHHISLWEIALAHLALWEVRESVDCWRKLEREATWSRACYSYGAAVCLLQLGGEENNKEAQAYLEKIPKVLQRIAGKSIPMEVNIIISLCACVTQTSS